MAIEVIIFLVVGAFICGLINSSLGMMYGTILSPILLIAGFDLIVVVPAILFSQTIGGLTASIFHHRFKNTNFSLKSKNPKVIIKSFFKLGLLESFKKGTTRDFRVGSFVAIFGVIATFMSVLIAVNIPKEFLKTYIGLLVIFIGFILLWKPVFKFSWKKMWVVSIISAFNKSVTGGGFGPVVTSGQIMAGRDIKNSIGTTAFAGVPICIIGFLMYMLIEGISDWSLIGFLSIGAIIAAPFGARITASFKSEKRLKFSLGILSIFLGILVISKTWII